MYSIVMMMAMTSAPDMAAFGNRGCDGGRGCQGGLFSGRGGHACTGGSGCSGGRAGLFSGRGCNGGGGLFGKHGGGNSCNGGNGGLFGKHGGGNSCNGGRGGLFAGRGCNGGDNSCNGGRGGHFGRRGCNGGGLFGGRRHSCNGGNGCQGAVMVNDCCGGMDMQAVPATPAPTTAPAAPPAKMPETKPMGMTVAPASIVVALPADARLTFDGVATSSINTVRQFSTPAIPVGVEHTYVLSAEVVRDGKTLRTSREVTVRGGEVTSIELTAESFATLTMAN